MSEAQETQERAQPERPDLPADLSPARRRLLELTLRRRDRAGQASWLTVRPQWKSLVAIRSAGARPPLFCVHDSSGQVWGYRELGNRLDPAWPVYGVQVPDAGEAGAGRSLGDLVDLYVREIRELVPAGPYFLLGTCSGGLFAYAIACEIHARGGKVGLVALVDPTAAFPGLRGNYRTWPRRLVDLLLLKSPWHLENMLRLAGRERRDYVRQRMRGLFSKIPRMLGCADTTPEARSAARLENAMFEVTREFSPPPFPGRVVLFQSRSLFGGTRPNLSRGWSRVKVGEFAVHRLEGFAGYATYDARLRRWVHLLDRELLAAADGAPPHSSS